MSTLYTSDVLPRVVPVVAGVLGASGLAVACLPARVAMRRELRRRWPAWAVAASVLVGALALRELGAMVLALLLGLVAVAEYARRARLGRGERVVLALGALLLPPLALMEADDLAHPFGLRTVALLTAAGVLPALLSGDTARGGERAARTVFGLLWIPVALTGLVVLEGTALAVGVAVVFGDAGAWCGGVLLSCLGGTLARPPAPLSLSLPVSPDKTWAGVLCGGMGVAAGLEAAGAFTVTLWAAVLAGSVLGGPLVSSIEREAGAGAARAWLPGLGGLLDRIGPLLLALPSAMAVTL
ncbi:phosphatidate cytidylyltransferase [Streptomyces roseoverticillatus]|uniref:phosphatidate cytidylyltransferase n=1 Tax=Streptomyces roseoverticillatus TaxID=66429 RepID=UPI0004C13BF5|nr:phosphatidate cytidylyltransferase [Streptomyces roseoverticillatus]